MRPAANGAASQRRVRAIISPGGRTGKEARIGLLLGATACLLAVMVDWVVEELSE